MPGHEPLFVGIVTAIVLFVPVYDVFRSTEELAASHDVRVLAATVSVPIPATLAVVWPIGRLGTASADMVLETTVAGVYLFLTLWFWCLATYRRIGGDPG